MRRFLGAIVLLLGVAGATHAAGPPTRPNLLIVTLDTTRADHTSAYGYARPTTPRLAAFAKEGVRFEAAYAPMATTLPSHATMFTGLLPRTHGTLKNGLRINPSLPLLSEILAQQGYRTAAFLGSFAVSRKFGLQRGFDLYDDDFKDGQCRSDMDRWEGHRIAGEFCRRGDVTRTRAEAWLQENGYLPAADGKAAKPGAAPAEPFFVWVHFFDAHNPYEPPAEHAALFPPLGDPPTPLDGAIARYDAEVHFQDQEMGKLFDRLAAGRRLDDTLVIVVGDHGEGLMDHGWMQHGLQVYEEAVRVPFVVRWPAKLPAGKTIAEPVEVADVTPTVLELTGIAMPKATHAPEGLSLVAAMTGKGSLDPARPVLVQRRSYAGAGERGVRVTGDKSGIRVGDWKYIEAKQEHSFELYDLKADPGEKQNLAESAQAQRAKLASELARLVARPGVAAPAAPGVSEEDARRLKALGYVQ